MLNMLNDRRIELFLVLKICAQSSWNFTHGVPPARAGSVAALSRAAIAPGQGFGVEAMPDAANLQRISVRPRP